MKRTQTITVDVCESGYVLKYYTEREVTEKRTTKKGEIYDHTWTTEDEHKVAVETLAKLQKSLGAIIEGKEK